MARVSTSAFQERGINAILEQQRAVSETQLQISTGKKISSPADDPVNSSRLLNLKNSQAQTEKYQSNIETADTKLSFAEVALNSFNKSIIKLKELAINLNNGSYTSTEKLSIQQEMSNLLDGLVDTANTKLAGEYIFSGFKTLTKPITENSPGVFGYAGDEGIQVAQVGPSTEVAVNIDGKKLFFTNPADDVILSGYTGLNTVTSAVESLQAPGLNVLNTNELKINDVTIGAAVSDGVSSSEATASAIATANAINALTSEHNVRATVAANVVTLTNPVYNTGANQLTAGHFQINGVNIIGDPTDQASFIQIINDQTELTGVVASVNGLNIDLTAADGRNIHLQSDGNNAEVDFTNFSIDTADNQIQRARITLTDHNPIKIAGSTPGDVGFVAGTTNNAAGSNAGTGVLSTPIMVDVIPDGVSKDETYLIQFNADSTFSVYAESNPTTALTGLSNVTYNSGDNIKINGIQVQITGTPSPGDVFTVTSEAETTIDLFSAVKNLINSISVAEGDNLRLNYLIGVGINNLQAAETRVLEVRADLGARINFIQSQKDSNEQFIIFSEQGISQLEDLDFVSAITTLTQQTFALEAAQSAYIKIQSLSLFNFL